MPRTPNPLTFAFPPQKWYGGLRKLRQTGIPNPKTRNPEPATFRELRGLIPQRI